MQCSIILIPIIIIIIIRRGWGHDEPIFPLHLLPTAGVVWCAPLRFHGRRLGNGYLLRRRRRQCGKEFSSLFKAAGDPRRASLARGSSVSDRADPVTRLLCNQPRCLAAEPHAIKRRCPESCRRPLKRRRRFYGVCGRGALHYGHGTSLLPLRASSAF